jgi:hypothetical protein
MTRYNKQRDKWVTDGNNYNTESRDVQKGYLNFGTVSVLKTAGSVLLENCASVGFLAD